MSLIKWEPLGELDHFFDNRVFPLLSRPMGFDLAVDVYEENGNVIAKMSLPGLKPEEVEVSAEDNSLTISGRREEEKETKEKTYYSKEIRRGSFSRTVTLPTAVKAEDAEARFEDGMLIVTVPVVEGAKEKVVKVPVNK